MWVSQNNLKAKDERKEGLRWSKKEAFSKTVTSVWHTQINKLDERNELKWISDDCIKKQKNLVIDQSLRCAIRVAPYSLSLPGQGADSHSASNTHNFQALLSESFRVFTHSLPSLVISQFLVFKSSCSLPAPSGINMLKTAASCWWKCGCWKRQ